MFISEPSKKHYLILTRSKCNYLSYPRFSLANAFEFLRSPHLQCSSRKILRTTNSFMFHLLYVYAPFCRHYYLLLDIDQRRPWQCSSLWRLEWKSTRILFGLLTCVFFLFLFNTHIRCTVSKRMQFRILFRIFFCKFLIGIPLVPLTCNNSNY